MKIVKVPLEKLRHPEKNVRRHSEKQIAEFVRSVNMFGQIRPICADENFVMLTGNGLYEALLRTGATEAYCYILPELTDSLKKKLMLADNRIFSLGADNMDVFDEIIAELGGDIDVPGYDEELLRTLTASTADIDQMIRDYGTFDSDARQAMQESAQQPEAAQEQRNDTFQPLQASAPIGHSPATPALETPLQAPTGDASVSERIVICPHCGGRVPIQGVV